MKSSELWIKLTNDAMWNIRFGLKTARIAFLTWTWLINYGSPTDQEFFWIWLNGGKRSQLGDGIHDL